MPYIFIERGDFCLLVAERTVIWKKPASGDKFAPYKRPADFIDLVQFCSDWDYYTLHSRTAAPVTHQAVAGQTIYDDRGFGTKAIISVGQALVQTQVLVDHNLGYPPRFRVAQNNRCLPSGMNVQDLGNRGRFVSFHATATQIVVRNLGVSSDVALPAVAVNYDVLVFKSPDQQAPYPRLPLFWAGVARSHMGRGKIDTALTTMRVGDVADSPFFIPLGRNVDFDNGASRVVVPNGPTITQTGYGGSFAGSPFLRTFV